MSTDWIVIIAVVAIFFLILFRDTIRCKLGSHDWYGHCTCANCGKIRDEGHDWSKNCEVCAKCGKTRSGVHTWDGCKCSECSKVRDEGHDWSKNCEKCEMCGRTRSQAHRWVGYECADCGELKQIDELISSSDSRAVEPLIKALFLYNKKYLGDIAKALGNLRDPRAVEPLLDKLGYDSYSYNREVGEALYKLVDSNAVDPLTLIKALRHTSVLVRKFAAETLGNLRDPRAVEHLMDIINSNDTMVHEEAMKALEKIGDSRAVDSLVRHLDRYQKEATLAADILGNLGDSRAVPPLIKALNHSDNRVRRSAAEALVKLNKEKKINQADWLTIKELAGIPHKDFTTQQGSSDCSTHTDEGLGLSLKDF